MPYSFLARRLGTDADVHELLPHVTRARIRLPHRLDEPTLGRPPLQRTRGDRQEFSQGLDFKLPIAQRAADFCRLSVGLGPLRARRLPQMDVTEQRHARCRCRDSRKVDKGRGPEPMPPRPAPRALLIPNQPATHGPVPALPIPLGSALLPDTNHTLPVLRHFTASHQHIHQVM
jgi:hypothetical protein